MLQLLFLLCMGDQNLETLRAERQYLDMARLMAPAAHQLEDPQALRDYVVFVSEHYSSQIAFRSFFLKNLRPGENLQALRLNSEQVTMDTHGRLMERNLEALLKQALAKYPDNPDVAFAVSCYLFRGRSFIKESKLDFPPKKIFDTFRAAYERDLVSVASLVGLTMEALGRDDRAAADVYLRKGLVLKPDDPDLVYANVDGLLAKKQFDQAIVEARKLFEISLIPEVKADALIAAARALYGQKQFKDAAETALSVHQFAPIHHFAFQVGLDAYRASGDGEAYRKAVSTYITTNEQSPEHFQGYMDYLRLRKISDDDRKLMASYKPGETEDPLVHITRLVNLGSYTRLDGQPTQAKAYISKARALAEKLENPPPDLIPILDKLLEMANTGGK